MSVNSISGQVINNEALESQNYYRSGMSNGLIDGGAAHVLSSSSIRSHEEELEDDLDVDEFDIPPAEVQCLDQILNEPDGSFSEADELVRSIEPELAANRSFVSHQSSTTTLSSVSTAYTNYEKEPEILRCSKMRGLSAQVNSAKEHVNAGSPSCMVIGKEVAAVGTTHSLVLVFDLINEVLKFAIGHANKAAELGQVSSMGLSALENRIVVGYSRGLVSVYDISGQSPVQIVASNVCHSIGHAVLHAYITEDPNTLVILDSGGSVFRLDIAGLLKKSLSSTCVFSGSKGEACGLSPLLLRNSNAQAHPASVAALVGIGTLTKVIVVQLKPKVKVLFALNLTGSSDTLPVVSWSTQLMPIQGSTTENSTPKYDPILCFARGHALWFYHVRSSHAGSKDVQFKFYCLSNVTLDGYSIMNVSWMNKGCLSILDTRERLHLFDLFASEELESMECGKVHMIYQVSDFKGLASGGNVSPAFAYAANVACYQSVKYADNKVYLLGEGGIFSVSIRSWLDRVNVHVKRNDYAAAIRLCLSFFEGKTKLGLGFTRSAQWKNIICDQGIDLVFTYLDRAMTDDCPDVGRIEVLQQHYRFVIPLCVDACLRLDYGDLVYERIWPRISQDIIARHIFLDCLEDNVTAQRRIRSLPPELLQELCSHLEQEGLLGSFEQCVLSMDIEKLDIHQVMKICRSHKLYDPIIYVFNNALQDYISPLEDMLYELSQVVSSDEILRDQDILLGNKVLLYLSCCFCGRAYPVGQLSPEMVNVVCLKVYKFVTNVRSDKNATDEPTYPYLRILLKFDSHELLNVFAIAFESEVFGGNDGNSLCQRLIDILVQLLLTGADFSVVDQSALFTFTARQLIRHSNLTLTRPHLHQLLESVMCAKDSIWSSSFMERQQALLDLLQTPRTLQMLDRQRVYEMAEKARFWQACEFILWKQRDFSKVLDCYLNDPARENDLYNCLARILALRDLTPSEKLEVRQKILESAQQFARLDCAQFAKVVNETYSDVIATAAQKLSSNAPLQLLFLRQLIEFRGVQNEQAAFSNNEGFDTELGLQYVHLLCFGTNADGLLLPESQGIGEDLESRMSELLAFLRQNVRFSQVEKCMEICRAAQAVQPVVFMLEEKKLFSDAFEYLLEYINEQSHPQETDIDPERLKCACIEAMLFCRRNSDSWNLTEKQNYWFSLFDAMLQFRNLITDVMQEVIEAMLVHVDASELMNRLFKHDLFASGRFGDIEPMLRSIFDNYSYQEVLYSSVVNLLHRDELSALDGNKRLKGAPLKFSPENVSNLQCRICCESINDLGHTHLLLFEYEWILNNF